MLLKCLTIVFFITVLLPRRYRGCCHRDLGRDVEASVVGHALGQGLREAEEEGQADLRTQIR